VLTGVIAAAGVYSVRARRRLLRLMPARPVPLPREGSAARQPMVDLAKEESAMATVVDRLFSAGRVEEPALHRLCRVWADISGRLRALASRLEGVELAAEHASPTERATLADGVSRLRVDLVQGVEDYRGLVAIAGRVLHPDTWELATDELVEALDGAS
jgi:hypothetical protein